MLPPSLGTPFPTLSPGSAPKPRLFCQPRKGTTFGLFLVEQLDFAPQTRSGLGRLSDPVSSSTKALGSGRLCSAVSAPHEGWPGLRQPWLQEPLRGCRQPSERSRGRTLPELFHQPPSPARPSQHIPKNSPAKQASDYQEIRRAKPQQTPPQLKQTAVVSFPISEQKTPRGLGAPGRLQRGKSLQKEERAQRSGFNSGHFIPTLERNHCRDLSSLGLSIRPGCQHKLMQNLCATSSLQEEFATPRQVLRAGLLQTRHIFKGNCTNTSTELSTNASPLHSA